MKGNNQAYYQLKQEQGRYLNQGDIIVFKECRTGWFGITLSKKSKLKIISEKYERESGWDITFRVKDMDNLTRPPFDLTVDMMDHITVYRAVGRVKEG